jgi:hypothetical protein
VGLSARRPLLLRVQQRLQAVALAVQRAQRLGLLGRVPPLRRHLLAQAPRAGVGVGGRGGGLVHLRVTQSD